MRFFGVAAGALLPLSKTSDVYNTGYTVQLPIGILSPSGRAGLRLDLGYGYLGGKDITVARGQTIPTFGGEASNRRFVGQGGNPTSANITAPPMHIYTVGINGILRRPFGAIPAGGTVPGNGIYITGGGGVAHVRSFILDAREQDLTRPFWNGGAGIDFGLGTRAKAFVEARFQQILTPKWTLPVTSYQNVNAVPIIVGLKF